MIPLIFTKKRISSKLLVSRRKYILGFSILALPNTLKDFLPWRRTSTRWESSSSKAVFALILRELLFATDKILTLSSPGGV